MRTIIIALFVLSIGFTSAYGQQVESLVMDGKRHLVVELPIQRQFEMGNCYMMNTTTFLCLVQWGVSQEAIDSIPQTPPFGVASPEYDFWIDNYIPMIESNPDVPIEQASETAGLMETIEDDKPTALETLDPEVRRALDKLGICQFGDGNWAGIVANYTREVPDELPIFTSGLDKQPILAKLAKSFEECKGKRDYPWLSQQNENRYLADLLGLDYYGRDQTNFGLDDSRNYVEQKTASQEEKDFAAAESKKYMCNEENLHLKLCSAYMELTGENRGNPEPIISDQDSYNQYLSDQAGSILTAQDYTNFLVKIKVLQCEEYSERYEHKIRHDVLGNPDYSNYPGWLMHCHE